MKDNYRVVVIGGGIVGVSVLYHLAHRGITDAVLIERSELTAGSTWHAAAGFHAINEVPRLSALQHYTIGLYEKIQAESGQGVGIHHTGGLNLATTPERWEWLKAEWALFRGRGFDARLVERDEIAELCPIVDLDGVEGGLFDPEEGHLDPHGATHAYAAAARTLGSEVVLHNRVLELRPTADGWHVETEQGAIQAEHVINAAGLWARRVGRMAGVDLPVVPMQHHYLVTEDVPQIAALTTEMPAVTDLEGFTYLRQEQNGVLLGVYERNPKHWQVDGAEWDYGMVLIPEEVERISEELAIGFARFPALAEVGIRRWVNGALTFTPDGNPIVGPVAGLHNYWVACGSMAGFSQCGAMGLAIANWIADGDPGDDVLGMDIARYPSFAHGDRYLRDTTAQFYARRFVMAYPNEELPAGRPLKTTGAHDMLAARGARFGAIAGMEVPQYFAPDAGFTEQPTLRRSNAHDIVAREVAATRTGVGAFETAVYARYEISGPGAESWLDEMLSCRIPDVGRVRLAPMLNESGYLMADFTVSRLAENRFWLVGSYHVQDWHMRWFKDHLPPSGVTLENLTDRWMGFAISGPSSRELVSRVCAASVAADDFRLLSCMTTSVGYTESVVARLSLTGELGFEISVPAVQQRSLWSLLSAAGEDLGLTPYGLRALDSMRLEKGYGVWSAEYTPEVTAAESGLAGHVVLDKPRFIGRDAVLRSRDTQPSKRLVMVEVEASNADPAGNEPAWVGDRIVGLTTSGGYGHFVGKSLAMAYVDRDVDSLTDGLRIHVMGEPRPARILDEAPYDPAGLRIRS